VRARLAIAAVLSAALCSTALAQPEGMPAPPPPAPEDPARKQWVEEFEELGRRYMQASEEQQTRMRALLLREFDRRLKQLDKRYAAKLTAAEQEKHKRQLEAIALLEKFIQDHPKHEVHTPDAMYRLAALYLDQAEQIADAAPELADADYSKSLALWERILKEFPKYRQTGATMYLYATYIGTRPVTDPVEERRAIQVYRALVCHNKFEPFGTPPPMLEREEVQKRLESKQLVNPYTGCEPVPGTDPELVLYAWVRGVGASHFATPGEMDEAIAGYSYGLDHKGHKLYDEALYMLAWSYYRRDILDKALELFDKSIVRYDQVVAEGGKPSLKLRDEALQYIAVTLTDPWDGEIDTDPEKAWERAVKFYEGRENEPHVREVWVTLGKAFYDLGGPALDYAIKAYRKAISEPWHLHPDNPVVHTEIVNVWIRKGDKDGENAERARLATRYAPCPEDKKATRTPEDPCGRWYEANETNRVAMENYRRIGESMLKIAATTTHNRANEKWREWNNAPDGTPEKAQLWQETMALYEQALEHYRNYIETYPAEKDVYTFTFSIAEVLYYMGRYLDQPGADGVVSKDEEGAVRHYAWVRDHRNLSSRFFEDSVLGIVRSYKKVADQMIAAGTGGLKPIQGLKVTQQGWSELPAAQEIPPVHKALRQAYDDYARLVNHSEHAADFGFNAALISFVYFHWDDAIARFEKVMTRFCGTKTATEAKDNILDIYQVRQDDEAFRRLNRVFVARKCGDAAAIAAAEKQNRELILVSANRIAEDPAQFAEAAQQYYQYFHDAPKDDPNRALALYNAAQLYENAGEPRRALYLFKEFANRAESSEPENKVFRDSHYRLRALLLYADSFGNAYDYAGAAKKYLEIYKLASNPKKYGVKPPEKLNESDTPPTFAEIKLRALKNAAAYYELDRDFSNALKYYREYEKQANNTREKDRAAWAIARIYKSQGNLSSLESAWKSWRNKYGNTKGNELDVISSYYELAKLYRKRNGRSNQRKADSLRADTVNAWKKINWDNVAKRDRVLAARMAGEYDFEMAEEYYQKNWVPAKITKKARTINQSGDLIVALEKKAKAAIDKYDKVGDRYSKYTLQYKAAGQVRVAKIYLDFIARGFNAPLPYWVEKRDRANPGFIAQYEQALRQRLEGCPVVEATGECQKDSQGKDKPGFREIAEGLLREVVKVASQPGSLIPKKWVSMAKDELNTEFGATFPILNEEIVDQTEAP
jgi:tetratricopeptide (TPR) repeat protein